MKYNEGEIIVKPESEVGMQGHTCGPAQEVPEGCAKGDMKEAK